MRKIVIPNSALRTATTMVRDACRRARWPAAVIRQLNVTASNAGALSVTYPDSLKAEITDLEYGSEIDPPRPAIRVITEAINTFISSSLEEDALSGLLS